MNKMNELECKALDSLVCGKNPETGEQDEQGDRSFAKAVVEISKLLVERWLQTPRGKQFHKDVEDTEVDSDINVRVRRALENQGIHLASWITPELNLDSYDCSLECDSSKPDFALKWRIPYHWRTKEEVSEEKLRDWIALCDEWLKDERWKDPEPDFPDTPSMYIPLATT